MGTANPKWIHLQWNVTISAEAGCPFALSPATVFRHIVHPYGLKLSYLSHLVMRKPASPEPCECQSICLTQTALLKLTIVHVKTFVWSWILWVTLRRRWNDSVSRASRMQVLVYMFSFLWRSLPLCQALWCLMHTECPYVNLLVAGFDTKSSCFGQIQLQ